MKWTILDKEYEMETKTQGSGHKLFSPDHPDTGTLAMLRLAGIRSGDKVLDLGCGCGTVGLYAASQTSPENITMTDIDPSAVEVSKANALRNGIEGIVFTVSDGLKNIPDRDYDIILSNPPYHADFSIPREFIEDGFRHLKTGGRMVMVTKRRLWYENKLKSVFGGVRTAEADGYFIFISEKHERKHAPSSPAPSGSNSSKEKPALSRKLARKYGHPKKHNS